MDIHNINATNVQYVRQFWYNMSHYCVFKCLQPFCNLFCPIISLSGQMTIHVLYAILYARMMHKLVKHDHMQIMGKKCQERGLNTRPPEHLFNSDIT
jgi:hypothetical protein